MALRSPKQGLPGSSGPCQVAKLHSRVPMETDPAPNLAQPKARRRWFQFSLRTLLIGVTLAGCGFGWLGVKVREARRQAAIVASITKRGAAVLYDYDFD